MSPLQRRRLQKSWHLLRRRVVADPVTRDRLVVEKMPWLHGATSPVMLSIDDLTNAWHGNGDRWQRGGDWGGGLHADDSAIRFLEDELLRDFPEIKVTFFVVAGPISAYTHHQPFSYAAPLDADQQSRHFFRELAQDPRFELAYHGYNHGTSGASTEQFVQEWRGFRSPEAAAEQTQRGLEIFSRAIGEVPSGGKYGGWDYNEFADDVIDQCGFSWWCRDWTPRDVNELAPDGYYEPQIFGDNLVVALPTTVHGRFWDRRQVRRLLQQRQLIAVEEHIAPIRPDGLIQTPNIVDDIDDLRRLFTHLRGKNVWYATGSEVAHYVNAREHSLIHNVTKQGFALRYQGRVRRPSLSLRVDCSAICTPELPRIEITLPDGGIAVTASWRFDPQSYQHRVTVPAMSGHYQVRPVAAEGS